MPQTLREIRSILQAAGLSPSRRLGQHFMIDGNLMLKVLDAAEITPDCAVLEVGCGTGSLTELLLERAGWVVGVEIDRGLAACVRDRLGARGNLTLVHADVLASKSRMSPEVLRALQPQVEAGRRLCLVANLPYNIASPLLIDLLYCGVPFQRCCVVIQKEVAERIVASPGGREFGPLSVVLQACAEVQRVLQLPPQAFWPVPRVASQALRLDIHKRPFANDALLQQFIAVVRSGFAHRRKTLHYNLRSDQPARIERALEALGLDPRVRAEVLPVQTWLQLFGLLSGA